MPTKVKLKGYWIPNTLLSIQSHAWICTRKACRMAASLEGLTLRACPPLSLPSGSCTCRVCKRIIGKKSDREGC